MSDRLERNVIIARSGTYKYDRDELPKLNLTVASIPEQHRDKTVLSVYTPSSTLIEARDLFVKLPLTKEHPPVPVTADNFQQYACGWTGDTADVVPVGNEIGISSTCQLLDRDVLEYYENDYREVSPGYFAMYEWRDGVSPDGDEYQIVKTKILEVNHLAFTRSGRGGPEISMDSLIYMTMDSKEPSFRAVMEDIVENAMTYDSDEIKMAVDAALGHIKRLPECKEKSTLTRIVQDLYRVKDFTGDSALPKACEFLTDKFDQIMEESMALFKKKPTTDAAPPDDKEVKAVGTDEPEAPAEPAAPAEPSEPEAPPASGEAPQAPAEPIAQAVMEVKDMPDDVSSLSDDQLRAFLNGVVRFLKTIAPGEEMEPEHQEVPATPDSDVQPETGVPGAPGSKGGEPTTDDDEMSMDDDEKAVTTDSLFKMPLTTDSPANGGFKDLLSQLSTKRSKN